MRASRDGDGLRGYTLGLTLFERGKRASRWAQGGESVGESTGLSEMLDASTMLFSLRC